MLIKDNHRLPKINRFDKWISYIGLNLVLGLTHGLAFKRCTQMHALLDAVIFMMISM